MLLTGGCLCGGVRYEIEAPLRHVTHCHCSMCRKFHGAAFGTYAVVASARIKLVADSTLRAYRSSSRVSRKFCATCGSSLFWDHDDHPDKLGIAIGALDDDPIARPEAHIYVKDQACWFQITDELPRYDRDPE